MSTIDQRCLSLWPTPLGLHRYSAADALNGNLVRMFTAMRATQLALRGQGDVSPPAFFASSDDLLERIRLSEWEGFVRFVVDSLRDTVAAANQGAWPEAAPGLRMAINGMWFQISNQGVHHDVHTHGNCSWSGVYCVQVDAEAQRVAHPVLGAHNGITRFYGPRFGHQAGAYMDFGNAYLQAAHLDVAPVPGQLVLFPSWLAHQAMPYQGSSDRIIISFNASVHAAAGSDQLASYAAR